MLFSKNGKGGSYLKGVILHNVQLQVADQLASTGVEIKALQHDMATNMTEDLAEELTENVLKQMNDIVDKEIEFVPLTVKEYKNIKKLEEDIANDRRDVESEPKVNLYLAKLAQLESEDEQMEPVATTAASSSASSATSRTQQAPHPWPLPDTTGAKKAVTWETPQKRYQATNRCLTNYVALCQHHHQYQKIHKETLSFPWQKTSATSQAESDRRKR